jgi:hypothetical protein
MKVKIYFNEGSPPETSSMGLWQAGSHVACRGVLAAEAELLIARSNDEVLAGWELEGEYPTRNGAVEVWVSKECK